MLRVDSKAVLVHGQDFAVDTTRDIRAFWDQRTMTCLCYVTAGSHDDALRIARAVVAEQLAACANVIGGMTSVYRWDGAVQEDAEVVLLLKTRAELVERLTARVVALHSYDCPCVVALPIEGGNPAFLRWIDAETADL